MAANLRTGNLSGGAPDFAAGHQDVKQVRQRVSATIILYNQCCGSKTFWYGSGSVSSDPCLCLMDPDSDPDPAIFVIDLQYANRKLIIFLNFFCLLLFEGTFTSFFKDKKSKRSNKSVGIKVCLTIFA
jgi:hypothetical protein